MCYDAAMSARVALALTVSLLLAACAGPETHELAGSCWQDDPSSRWVVENELHARADQACRGKGWTALDKREELDEGLHIYRWTVACVGKPE